MFPKLICIDHCSLSENPDGFLGGTLLIPKYIWKCRGPIIAKILSKKTKVEVFALSNIKIYYKALIIKTGRYW